MWKRHSGRQVCLRWIVQSVTRSFVTLELSFGTLQLCCMLVMDALDTTIGMELNYMNMSKSKFYRSKPAPKIVKCILCSYEGRERGFVKVLGVWIDYECLLRHENAGDLKEAILQKMKRKNAQEK